MPDPHDPTGPTQSPRPDPGHSLDVAQVLGGGLAVKIEEFLDFTHRPAQAEAVGRQWPPACCEPECHWRARGLICTRFAGHDGPHVAHGHGRVALAAWPFRWRELGILGPDGKPAPPAGPGPDPNVAVFDHRPWMNEARQLAAQCWCDDDTAGIPMNPVLAEAVARRIRAWMDTAAQEGRNVEFHRGLLVQIARAIGQEAYVSDDASLHDSPILLNLPGLVMKKLAGREENPDEGTVRLSPEILREWALEIRGIEMNGRVAREERPRLRRIWKELDTAATRRPLSTARVSEGLTREVEGYQRDLGDRVAWPTDPVPLGVPGVPYHEPDGAQSVGESPPYGGQPRAADARRHRHSSTLPDGVSMSHRWRVPESGDALVCPWCQDCGCACDSTDALKDCTDPGRRNEPPGVAESLREPHGRDDVLKAAEAMGAWNRIRGVQVPSPVFRVFGAVVGTVTVDPADIEEGAHLLHVIDRAWERIRPDMYRELLVALEQRRVQAKTSQERATRPFDKERDVAPPRAASAGTRTPPTRDEILAALKQNVAHAARVGLTAEDIRFALRGGIGG